MLAHLGAYVGASLGVFLAIYVATPSRCQLFRFFPLPGAQNHVKTTVFEHRQDRRRGRRGARNTVKNDVFEPYTQNTWKITGCKCGRGSTRAKVGRRQGASTHITFGYQPKASGISTGQRPGPAPGFKGLRLTAGRRPKKGRRKYVEPRSVRVFLLVRSLFLFFFFFFLLLLLLLLLLSSSSSASSSSSSSSSSCRAWSCSCSSHMFGPKYPSYDFLGPSLGLSWPHVRPVLAYVGPILALCWPILAPSWPYLGPMLAHLGPMLALGWPMLALCWPMLAPCWPILGPMLALAWAFFWPSMLQHLQDANFSDFFPSLEPKTT